jgi:cytochrome P450 / NADPH-cytochrome P450 reductase
MSAELKPIPQPAGLPLLGNMREIDPESPMKSILRLAETYGEIFSLSLGGERAIYVSTQALAHEVCDEKR